MLDSRATADEVRRRRECMECGRRFTTYERIAPSEIRVQKHGERGTEAFDRDKIVQIVRRVAKGRPLEPRAGEDLARRVEARLVDEGAKIVRSELIAEWIRAMLRELDDVAAARFASNYEWDEGGSIKSAEEAPSPQLPLPNVPSSAPVDEPPAPKRRGHRRA